MMVPTDFEAWFAVSDHVTHDRTLQGVRNLDDRLVLGWRAGPSEPELTNMAHEMAHMIEIPHNRVWWQYGWGLTFRETWVYDRMCSIPLSDTGTRREIRVIAIQWLLQDHFAVESSQVTAGHVRDIVQSLKYVYDHCFYTYKRPRLRRLPYAKQDETATRIAIRDVLRYKRTLSIDQLWRQWCEKCEVLDHVLAA